jgi:hypothetical protein
MIVRQRKFLIKVWQMYDLAHICALHQLLDCFQLLIIVIWEEVHHDEIWLATELVIRGHVLLLSGSEQLLSIFSSHMPCVTCIWQYVVMHQLSYGFKLLWLQIPLHLFSFLHCKTHGGLQGKCHASAWISIAEGSTTPVSTTGDKDMRRMYPWRSLILSKR